VENIGTLSKWRNDINFLEDILTPVSHRWRFPSYKFKFRYLYIRANGISKFYLEGTAYNDMEPPTACPDRSRQFWSTVPLFNSPKYRQVDC
jgi:hypothetical protein